MPPALSDSESSVEGESSLPVRPTRKGSAKSVPDDVSDANDSAPAPNVDSADEGSEQDEDKDLGDDVFIVEAIKKHMIDEDGTLKFQVKWEGYDSPQDLTWEPEENLQESASDILDEYLKKCGGRDAIFDETDKAVKTKKRGRKANGTPASSVKRSRKNGTHPTDTIPPASAKQWSPPAGSWEDEIQTIDACEGASGELVVYLIWKNGQKTKHPTSIIYKKCPQKRHLRELQKSLQLSQNALRPRTSVTMKKNDVIAVIIIILFLLLAGVSFGIWKLVTVAKNSMTATSGSGSSGSDSDLHDG
ncbi:hypothetical protein BGZ63DRAFT_421618 [Mariannaea sp. PMI_226]|nr:hypothetical protein BGZ63DRAFT_421618 [Mariannaea sp. PMI_226]